MVKNPLALSPFARAKQNLDWPYEFARISHRPPAPVADFAGAAPARGRNVIECLAARPAVIRAIGQKTPQTRRGHAGRLSTVAG